MECRGGVPGAQWCAANCRKVFSGKGREIAASQVSSLEPLGPRESLDGPGSGQADKRDPLAYL